MGRLGPTEIILILVVIILLFGAKKLPDMARSLGKSARILKSEAKAMKSDDQQSAPADPPHMRQRHRHRHRHGPARPAHHPGRSRRRDQLASRDRALGHHQALTRSAAAAAPGGGLPHEMRTWVAQVCPQAGEGSRGSDAPRGAPA